MAKILERISSPADVKKLNYEELLQLCREIREEIIKTVSDNGGHLASNLGVVELTVALCYVFDFPEDSVIWDVGHQSYPYKILTGRSKDFYTIRSKDGLSGFPCRNESPYDVFTAGHSSTSISAGLGISEANYLQGRDNFVVSVIGDGALSGGLAYEGLNNAGRIHRNFIVVLNDNNMSISKNVGSMARYLTFMRTRPNYIKIKNNLETNLNKIPFVGRPTAKLLKIIKNGIKKLFYKTTVFEDMGFAYYGPFDGHDLRELLDTFNSAKLINKPLLLHVRTYKGKGYKYAERDPQIYHGLSGFDVSTGETGEKSDSFSSVFGEKLCELAAKNEKICAVTAAMKNGTGLVEFKEKYKNRFYDVGIAEEHAVTFSGGLAAGGMLPVFAVYSTFLQRSFDELIHDVSLQQLKVILAIDRAGVVGEDGKTHQGLFDTSFLQEIPNVTLYSPAFFSELELDLEYLVQSSGCICAVRYPRGRELYKPPYYIEKTDTFQVFGDFSAEIAIVTYGRLFSFAATAAERLQKEGVSIRLIKLNRIIPVDPLAPEGLLGCEKIFFFEEGLERGGIGEHFLKMLSERRYAGKFFLRGIKDPFIPHAPMFSALADLGLSAEGMTNTVLSEAGGESIEKKA